jgi:hypothetical protein
MKADSLSSIRSASAAETAMWCVRPICHKAAVEKLHEIVENYAEKADDIL